jgi:phage pi2 protein 07
MPQADPRPKKRNKLDNPVQKTRAESEMTKWNFVFDKLEDFCKKNGNCKVPNQCLQDPTLASWVATQRAAHKKNKLPNDRMERLNNIGFVWVPNAKTESEMTKWIFMFDKLEDFHKKNEHCMVPCPQPLCSWVHTQKQRVSVCETNKKSGLHATLTVGQHNRLIKLGVVGHDAISHMQHFKHRLSECDACIKKDNSGAVDVPLFENYSSLCRWVESQIAMCRIPGFGASGKTSEERLKLFKQAGIDLSMFADCDLIECQAGHPQSSGWDHRLDKDHTNSDAEILSNVVTAGIKIDCAHFQRDVERFQNWKTMGNRVSTELGCMLSAKDFPSLAHIIEPINEHMTSVSTGLRHCTDHGVHGKHADRMQPGVRHKHEDPFWRLCAAVGGHMGELRKGKTLTLSREDADDGTKVIKKFDCPRGQLIGMNEMANGMQHSKTQHQVMDAQGCAVLIVNGRFNTSVASYVAAVKKLEKEKGVVEKSSPVTRPRNMRICDVEEDGGDDDQMQEDQC